MKTIIHLLELTPKFYAKYHFDYYVGWCAHYGGKTNKMQMLLCNQRVYDWFCNEYRKQELLFLEQVNPASEVGEMRELYYGMISKVLDVYPRPFVKGLQKIEIQTTNYN